MTITVRYFAVQREQLGRRSEQLELPAGTTVAAAWARLVELYGVLAPATAAIRFARNGHYADGAETLADGDELALIPPVAGGSAGAPEDPGAPAGVPGPRLELTADPIDDACVAMLLSSVASEADGALAVFVGRTRETPGTPAPGQEGTAARFIGRRVEALEYEAYEPMVLSELGRIAREIRDRFGVERLAIVHRTGKVTVGEASVAIVCASAHREAAFSACRYAIEELKARVPIWKSERFAGGGVWLGAPARHGPDERPGPDES